MAVIKKSERVMELNNTISSTVGFLFSSLLILGGIYNGVLALLPGGKLELLVIFLLLAPWGFAFLINTRKVTIVLDKSSGKATYDMKSVRGCEHLEFPLRSISRITLEIRHSGRPGSGRSIEFCLILKDGKRLAYSTACLVFPPKELQASDFLGIPIEEVSSKDE